MWNKNKRWYKVWNKQKKQIRESETEFLTICQRLKDLRITKAINTLKIEIKTVADTIHSNSK